MAPDVSVVNQVVNASSIFPPSYANNPLVFSVALASMLFVSTISLATSIRMSWSVISARRRGLRWMHTMMLHRMFVIGLLVSIVMARLPDVVVNLMWGDPLVDPTELGHALIADKLLDGLSVLPFTVGMGCLYLASRGMTMFMLAEATAVDFKSTWPTLRVPLRIAMVVLLIAALVTVGKCMRI